MNQTVQYLQELTAIPSPTGFTAEVADYSGKKRWKDWAMSLSGLIKEAFMLWLRVKMMPSIG